MLSFFWSLDYLRGEELLLRPFKSGLGFGSEKDFQDVEDCHCCKQEANEINHAPDDFVDGPIKILFCTLVHDSRRLRSHINDVPEQSTVPAVHMMALSGPHRSLHSFRRLASIAAPSIATRAKPIPGAGNTTSGFSSAYSPLGVERRRAFHPSSSKSSSRYKRV